MLKRHPSFKTFILFLTLVVLISSGLSACLSVPSTTLTPTSRARQVETTRAADVTRKAESTSRAIQDSVSMTQTSAALVRAAGSPTPLPTYTPQPTLTPQPTYTMAPQPAESLPTMTFTPRPTFPPSFFPVKVSVTEFYCTQEPSEVKISASLPTTMSAALYYRLREKKSRVMTDWNKKELLPDRDGQRSALINGSIYKPTPSDIPYPALPKESVLEFQIISDDGIYRSIVYTDITYFPCPAEK